jgi:hypothetical protein
MSPIKETKPITKSTLITRARLLPSNQQERKNMKKLLKLSLIE